MESRDPPDPSRKRAIVALLLAGTMLSACAQTRREGVIDRLRQRRESDDPVFDVEEGAGGRRGGGVTLPPGARQETDVAYGPADRHKLDVYIPAGARAAPIVLFVHGGAWILGDKAIGRGVGNKVARWLPRGYIVVSTNYRKPEPPDPAQQADDVARALAFVQERAPQWGGAGDKVLLMGHSAGAHLASLVSADTTLQQRWRVRPWAGTVSLDSAAMDIVALMEGQHPRLYDRIFGADRSYWQRVSPYHRLDARVRPMLLVCSQRRADSCAQAQAFASRAQGLGGRVELLPLQMGHGAINSDLGLPGPYTDRVEAFMRSVGLP